MEVLHPRCAGLDIHKDSVVACARIAEGARVVRHVETFATTTADLERLSAWLKSHGVTHVVMEATGVYWKPVWAVLCEEMERELALANAAHVKAVPGRKTDVNDATWLADLLAHGLIRPSFVPPADVQALRDLTRTRKQFIRERSGHVQRIDKLLQGANLKLGSVLSDIMGQGGRAVLDALASGESDPERLADQVRTKVRASRAALVEALRGRLGAHQRVVLRLHLAQADAIEAAVAELDREVGDRLAPFCDLVARLSTMPGLSSVSASAILSEIGSDMSRFSTPAHLVSWAGLCPRNDESAGRRRSTRLRPGAPWLKTLLVQAAWSAVRVKASYHSALFYRLRARRGAKKAIVAVAASMLTAIHVMLARGVAYRDLGADHFERTNKERLAARLMRTLKQLGYTVALTPMNPTGPVPC
ncbi:MAG: IS110 family transposase [Xanthobacteraceae bacterium]